MSRIKTIATRDLNKSVQNGGCGECQTSCQQMCIRDSNQDVEREKTVTFLSHVRTKTPRKKKHTKRNSLGVKQISVCR